MSDPRQREESLRAQFRAIPIPTYSWRWEDGDFVLVDYSDAARAITQGGIEQIRGKRAKEVLQDRPDILADLHRCLKERTTIKREMRHQMLTTRDLKYLSVTYVFIAPDIVMVNTEDRTDQTQAEVRIRESEARFRAIFEHAGIGVALVSRNGEMLEVNRALMEMLGYDEAGLRRVGVDGVTHPEDLHTDYNLFLQLMDGQRDSYQIEKRYLRQSGQVMWGRLTCSLVRDSQGNPDFCIGMVEDVTPRRQAEEELRLSERRFRTMVEQSPLSIQLFAPDGNCLHANTAWEKLWNSRKDQLRGYNILQDPQLAAKGQKPFVDAAFAGQAVAIPAVLYDPAQIGKAGRPRWVEAFLYPVRDDQSKIREVALVLQDVTARITAEEALRETNQQLQALVQASPLALMVIDRAGIVRTWNPAAERIFGWMAEEVIGKFLPTIPADKRDEYRHYIEQSLAAAPGTGLMGVETRRQKKDGELLDVALWTAPLRDSAGAPYAVLSIVADITARKQAEAALLDSERRYSRLAEALPQLVWTSTADGHVDYLNDRWQEYTGVNPAQLHNWGWSSVVHPSDLPRTLELWTESLQTGEPLELNQRLRSRVGHYRWFLVRGIPIKNEAGQVVKWFGTCTDIEDQQRIEAELRQTKEILIEANRLKDEFLATVSHELRTPLNAILGWSHILQTRSLNEEEIKQAMATIERNARAQAQIINDILDVSRIITGKLQLELKPVDVTPAVVAAIEAVRPAAEVKGLFLETELDPQAQLISGDLNRLQQVAWNLLSNAVKFTPAGGKVRVKLTYDKQAAELTVSDTGAGINSAFLPFAFDRFRQADASHTRQHGGLGLGLAIVRHLVELHGGSVSAYSAGEGKGAVFTVRLPLATSVRVTAALQDPIPVSPESATATSARPPKPDLQGIRILTVDDEADTRQLIRTILLDCGAEVRLAASAAEALAAIQAWVPDVLLCDIGMPGEDGYSLIGQIRALPLAAGGNVPAIALTAYAREEDQARASAAGFQLHLAKPTDPEELIRAVALLIMQSKTN